MADVTDVLAIPFPEGGDTFTAAAVQTALERVDEVPGIESLTSAEISGLAAGEKPAGRVVYNSTTSKLQVSNGTSFADVDAAALLKAGGTMAGNIAMGGNKVTGLAAGTTAGDAVRYEQALLLAGGTMAGNINANGNKVTGLAAATTNGDAVRYEQLVAMAAATNYCTATQSGQSLAAGADRTVTYDGEIDPGNILNAATGVVTIPVKGLYTVSGGLGYTTSTIGDVFRRLRVVVSGSPIAEQSNVTNVGALNVSWTGVLNAAAAISLDCFHDDSGSLTGVGWLSVAFLGTVA